MRRNWPWLLAVALAVWGAWSYASRAEFEKRARTAERLSADRLKMIRVLDDWIADLAKKRTARAVVIQRETQAVAVADAASPPPDSCAPNLAARDSLIADQAAQIADDDRQIEAEHAARVKLQEAHDALRTALASRPRGLVRFAFLTIEKPAIGPFVGLDHSGKPVAGIGITIPIRIGG